MLVSKALTATNYVLLPKNLLTEQIFIKLEYDFLSYLIEGENI
jgi:hypothetical protein